MKILFVTPYLPSPPRSGGAARMHGLIRGLAKRGHHVHVLSLASPKEDVDVLLAETRAGCDGAEAVLAPAWAMTPRQKRFGQLRSLVSARSFEWRQHHLHAFQHALDRTIEEGRFDVISMEFAQMGCFRYAHRHGAKLVLDEHNIEFDIPRRTAGHDEGSMLRRGYNALNWRKLRLEEHSAWDRAHGVVLTSERDEALLHSERPGKKTVVVPNAVDLDAFAPSPALPKPAADDILFFGALNYYPNEEGLVFFLDTIWPVLRKLAPEVKLTIVGQYPPESLRRRAGPGINITGRVDDVRPWLARASAVIAPLRIGGGTRLKILEAMAMARPVVSTTLGAEGLAGEHGKELLIADEPKAFAEAVVRVLRDPKLAASLGDAARELVVRRYGWPSAVEKLEAFYRSL